MSASPPNKAAAAASGVTFATRASRALSPSPSLPLDVPGPVIVADGELESGRPSDVQMAPSCRRRARPPVSRLRLRSHPDRP